MAQALQGSNRPIVIEGYADKTDGDKYAASLDRANRVREQLIRNGVESEPRRRRRARASRRGAPAACVIVEAPPPPPAADATKPSGTPGAAAGPRADRDVALRVARRDDASPQGTSAMVSILDTETDGEVVYLYDAESPRGNAAFPFKAVRLKNPTDSALESGPVTVFGEGKFIGEGLSEPIPARSVAFVPFALDRQIVVERKDKPSATASRASSPCSAASSRARCEHTRRQRPTSSTTASPRRRSVYVRHTVAEGYKLTKAAKDAKPERLGAAHLFRVERRAERDDRARDRGGDAGLQDASTSAVAGRHGPGYGCTSPPAPSRVRSRARSKSSSRLHKDIGNVEQRIATIARADARVPRAHGRAARPDRDAFAGEDRRGR